MKIVLTDCKTIAKGDIDIDSLKEFGELIKYETTSDGQIAERIKDADAVLCNKTVLNRENMKNAKNLKYIGLFATGFNNIDLDLAKERNIPVCNVPGYSTDAVAQLTFAFILELANRVCDYNALVAKGDWIKSRTFSCKCSVFKTCSDIINHPEGIPQLSTFNCQLSTALAAGASIGCRKAGCQWPPCGYVKEKEENTSLHTT